MHILKTAAAGFAIAVASAAFAPANAQTMSDEHYAWCMEQHGDNYNRNTNLYYLPSTTQYKACSSPFVDFDTVSDDGTIMNPTFDMNRQMDESMTAQHVEWCTTRYPSYDAATNTYDTGDVKRACSSPYN